MKRQLKLSTTSRVLLFILIQKHLMVTALCFLVYLVGDKKTHFSESRLESFWFIVEEFYHRRASDVDAPNWE